MSCVQEHITTSKLCRFNGSESVARAQWAEHSKVAGKFIAQRRRDISVQLHRREADGLCELANLVEFRLNKHADRASVVSDRRDNFATDFRRDIARALAIKIQPDHISTELSARAGIVHVCNPADFYLHLLHDFAIRRSGYSRSVVGAINSRRAASGSGARINISPIKKASNPSA